MPFGTTPATKELRRFGMILICVASLPACIQSFAAEPASTQSSAPEEFAVGRDGRVLLLPLQLDQRTMMFCLDTGAAITAFDVSLRTELGNRQTDVVLGTSAGTLKAEQFASPVAYIGPWSLNKMVKSVTCVDLQALRYASGEQIYGVLGMDFLRHFAIEIDFDAGKVRLWKSAPSEWRRVGTRHALKFSHDGCPYIVAKLPSDEQEWFALDTGANNSTVRSDLFRTLVEQEHLIIGTTYVAQTAGGKIEGKSGYLSQLRLGDFSHERLRMDSDIVSILGLRYLSRYKLRLDLPGGEAFLDRGQRCSVADPAATSGLVVIQTEQKRLIVGVEPDGAASKAGLSAGDEIVAVNGNAITSYDQFALGQLLTSEVGRSIKLRVRRSDVERDCLLTLRSRIRSN